MINQEPLNYLDIYKNNYPLLSTCAQDIAEDIKEYLGNCYRIDQISARSKSIDRFEKKANKLNEDGSVKYQKPLIEIQDQIGVRIVTYYLSDVELLANRINEIYEPIEEKDKRPDRYDAFSYIGKHFILFIPDEVKKWDSDSNMPIFFELQIKTLFQHAWSESEHDLNYKTTKELSLGDKRLIAFSAAQAWGADKIFEELRIKYDDSFIQKS